MKNKIAIAVITLGSLILSLFAGCRPSVSKYIPQAIDSADNDKNRLGLSGKVKTMDIYYYRPEKTSSFFSLKFKKGEKWEEEGIHHYHLRFNTDGNFVEYCEYSKEGNVICKTDYTYEDWGHTSTLSYPGINNKIVRKYNTRGQLLERIYGDLYGEIHTYDGRGNLIRTEQIDGKLYKPAVIEYDYNDKNLMTGKREYYNEGELSSSTVYEYAENDLLVEARTHDFYDLHEPEMHFIYEYSDSNRVVQEYRVDADGNRELESWCRRKYHPNGKLKAVIRNSILQEEYDEQGRPVDRRPGFEILYKDFGNYEYDINGNWTEIKNFKDYVDLDTGLGRILKPYVVRRFTYYQE